MSIDFQWFYAIIIALTKKRMGSIMKKIAIAIVLGLMLSFVPCLETVSADENVIILQDNYAIKEDSISYFSE